MKRFLTIIFVLTCIIPCATAQTNLWTESFETDGEGTRYSNSNTFHDDDNDYYIRTDGTTPFIGVIGGPYVTSDGSFYFAGEDLDDNGGDREITKEFTKTGIDIMGYTSLSFQGLFGSGTTGWDADDYGISVEVQIDGGGYTQILSFKHDASGTNGGIYNSLLAQDIDGDGIGEGTILTPTLVDFTGVIVGTGEILDIRIISGCNLGDEEFAFDYLRVEGVLPSGNAEIELQNIVNGDMTPSVAEGTDFGILEVGLNSTSTIIIQNIGGMSLTTGAITITGADAADFAIANYTAGAITSGMSSPFDIVFTPSSVGTKNASISIVSDDADENPYNFDITGEGFILEKIAITEFMVNAENTGVEFVEIYNFGTTSVDLMNWRLKDEDTNDNEISTTSLIIEAGEYLILVSNKTGFETTWFNGNTCNQVIDVGNFVLENSEDEIILENGTGDIVWSLAYANDDLVGIATYYIEATFTNRFWGSKASPGVNRTGNDITGTLGYERNNVTADFLAFASANADMASPLNRTACYENEIDIQGGMSLTSITNADATPDVADGTLQDATIGVTNMQTFTIENQGYVADLIVSGITSDNAAFTISGAAFPLTIQVGMTATFTVESTVSNTETGTITVANDDADEASYTFDVSVETPALTTGDACTAASTAAVGPSGTMVHFYDASNQLVASVSSTGTDFSALGDEISFYSSVNSSTSNTAGDDNPYRIMGRQFNIESAVTPPYTGVTVRLYFNNTDYSDMSGVSCPTCPAMSSAATDVELSHYGGTDQNCDQSDNDFSTTASENLGGTYGTYGANAFYIDVTPTHFSEFFAHQANGIAFPVELVVFTGRTAEQNNVLNWQTATERNNDFFVVERSDNALNWTAITQIKGAGESIETIEYSFTDKNRTTTQYYRLKQVDFDGQSSYSQVVSITRKGSSTRISEFFPNPSHTGNVQMNYSSEENKELVVSVFDVAGRLVFSEVQTVTEGANRLAFDFETLGIGLYIVKLQAGNHQIHRKLMLK